MINYIKQHDQLLNGMLHKNPDSSALRDLLQYHDKQIMWIAHERLVHATVMLFVCLFMLLSLGFSMVKPTIPGFVITVLLLVLTVAYLIHYFRLENTVQRWYRVSNEIWAKINTGNAN
jgi:cell division protein FtsW (lipid II flippase)